MAVFDFGVGFPVKDEGNEFFIGLLEEDCRARRMKFIFIDAQERDKILKKLDRGDFKLKFYLDMASETFNPQDAYLKFAYIMRDAGARIMEDPDLVKVSADKSIMHANLARAGVRTPFTVIIKSGQSGSEFTEEESEKLGPSFIIKPSLGYGKRGVKRTTKESAPADIAELRKLDLGDNILAQEFIEPKEIEGKPAWFRAYHTLGAIALCWWDPNAHVYRTVTMREIEGHGLFPMVRIAGEIARIARIGWFSCEIALNSKDNGFVAVDYVNDQCWVNQQSKFNDGVPDEILSHIAERITEEAWNHINGRRGAMPQAIWLPETA